MATTALRVVCSSLQFFGGISREPLKSALRCNLCTLGLGLGFALRPRRAGTCGDNDSEVDGEEKEEDVEGDDCTVNSSDTGG